MKTFRVLATCMVAIAIAGCVSLAADMLEAKPAGYAAVVSTFARPDAGGNKTFVLLPAEDISPETELQFLEYSTLVERALLARGFRKAAGFETADLAIFIAYGISDPKVTTHTYRRPVWGQTGVTATTTGTTRANILGGVDIDATTTETPTYGMTGYRTETNTSTSFERYLDLTAYDLVKFRQNEAQEVTWDARVTSVGSSDDLRRVLPVMVAAARPYLGTSSGQAVSVGLTDLSAAVLEVRGVQHKADPSWKISVSAYIPFSGDETVTTTINGAAVGKTEARLAKLERPVSYQGKYEGKDISTQCWPANPGIVCTVLVDGVRVWTDSPVWNGSLTRN
jgi:hypothetical protein